jgi:hypothetical protein
MGGVTSTSFTSENQPTHVRTGRPKSPQAIVIAAIEKVTGGDLQGYWEKVIKKSMDKEGNITEEGLPAARMALDRTTPPVKAQMMALPPFDIDPNATPAEQANSVLVAVAAGVLPLDAIPHLLSLIIAIDTAKGGSLGNEGMDLSKLYSNIDGKATVEFTKQIALLAKKPQAPKPAVIDITPSPVAATTAPAQAEPITDAIKREGAQIVAAHPKGTESKTVEDAIDAAATRLFAIYPNGNQHHTIFNAIADVYNEGISK